MVQEKELRSGNLVYRVIEDYEPLAEKKVVEWGWDIVYRIGDCVDREENYEYIALTAERMEEFGFEYCGNGNFYFDGVIWDSRDGLLNIRSNWIDDYCYSLKVDYVHTLQNIYFALKGKELEIKTV